MVAEAGAAADNAPADARTAAISAMVSDLVGVCIAPRLKSEPARGNPRMLGNRRVVLTLAAPGGQSQDRQERTGWG